MVGFKNFVDYVVYFARLLLPLQSGTLKDLGTFQICDLFMYGIDLFAGAGGMSLGARDAGVNVLLAVESDPWAAKTYEKNHGDTAVICDDIQTITRQKLQKWKRFADELIVFGGPPCQGFSWSNVRTRNADNKANWLFEEFIRVVGILNPGWVVFENVQGIVDTARGVFLKQITDGLTNLGYELASRSLNAMHFGVPQDRTRFFIVGSRNGHKFRFPRKRQLACPTVDDAIRDLPRVENGASQCWLRYGKAKPSHYGESLRNGVDGCNNHLVSKNADYVVRRYRHIPSGGNWQSIPRQMMANYKDRSRCHTGIYHRLSPKSASVVIGNFRKNMLIHPSQDRGLTVREAARIQSFPDWYTFVGSIGFQQQQVGNAVPPLLAYAVFRSIARQWSAK